MQASHGEVVVLAEPLEAPGQAAYLGVVLDEEGVAEWEHGRRSLFVRRDQVHALRYEFGWRAERPIVQAIFGAVLLGVSVYVIAGFVVAVERTGRLIMPRTLAGFGTLFLLGAWALYGALRRAHFVRAELVHNDSRKFLLQGAFGATQFAAFVERAKTLGYTIRTS